MNRIIRFILILVVIAAAVVLAGVVALYMLVDDKHIENTFARLTKEAFGTNIELSRHVTFSRFPELIVNLPATEFRDPATGDVRASLDSATLHVALWSLPLGAVNITQAEVTGLVGALTLAAPTAGELSSALMKAINFPGSLRVKNITFNNATFDVTTGAEATPAHWKLSNVTLRLDVLSPEMTSGFDLTGSFASLPALKALPAPETTAELQKEATTAKSAESAGFNQSAEDTPPATESSKTSSPAATETPSKTPPQTQAAPAEVPTAPVKTDSPSVSLLKLFVSPTYAAQATPALPEQTSPATQFAHDFSHFALGASGTFSATGTVELSTSEKTVNIDQLKFSADVEKNGHRFNIVTAAQTLRLTDNSVTGTNVNTSVSEPQAAMGDLHFGAVDFRLIGARLQSPEMRIAYSKKDGERITTYEAASNVDADIVKRVAKLENLTSRITITGDASLPQDFTVEASGSVSINFSDKTAQASLSGNLAGTPFSFTGSAAHTSLPELQGSLMLSNLNLQSLPRFQNFDWMRVADFEGELLVGQITAGNLTTSQVKSRLSVRDGSASLTDLVVNAAGGRLLGKATIKNGAWTLRGDLDSVNIEKLLGSLGSAPLLSGITNGSVTASGTGTDPATITARGTMRLMRGAYKGLNARAVRDFIAGRGKKENVTVAGAWTEIDDAIATWALENRTLTLSGLTARSAHQKTAGDFKVNLDSGDIDGAAQMTFTPSGGIPSIAVNATIAGKVTAPEWLFDYGTARQNLLRAQGRPLVKEKEKNAMRRKAEDLWQSVKDFFRF